MGIFAWLKSRAAAALAAVAAIGAILLTAYSKGRSDSAGARNEDRLKAVKKAREVENETDALSGSDVDRRLDRWMRRDDKN